MQTFALNLIIVFVVFSSLFASFVMADSSKGEATISSEAKVYIISTDKPTDEEPETYHLRTLSSVLGSEEAAKDALIYIYKEVGPGFAAKLTPEQVDEISKQPGVFKVVRDKMIDLD